MSGATGGATAAAAAAAAAAARMREEEEKLTPYNADDLKGWEFKIVRANSRKFKHADAVRQLCEEEAQAGWEMVEKFDDSRIRFKRRVEERSQDPYRTIDPYRTLIGFSESHIVLIIVAVCLFLGLGLFLAFGLSR
ncbi:MAG: hypothetical protein GTO42_08490 [Candidatus Latescibacteria bacterium]|nr:hypothetical protein [Candidatus Latescibacterota bacterium]NIO28996.1 hypothetical protein [Candidatus Latescibacterota bacterium]NIO56621.1 hypothetical protein [Candidatus Latescibacterota bacterium]NIT02205.1 hypothetical protein [Candidatus Latescibacterota bacterium]NIT39090.1 hypothetical protein [Candidatus Latescibacterota bacterium]